MDRRLVAIVVADVVGYSRLMERDEPGTHQRLQRLRREVLDPSIAEHGGRTVSTAGDGTLLEFPSATAALRCAIDIQRTIRARSGTAPGQEQLQLRVGINLGDIIVQGDDIIGDGVNVAARLEALCEPGGICIAGAVREQVHEDLGVDFIDAGDQRVKNISRPVRVYRVVLDADPDASTSAQARRPFVLDRRWRMIAGAVAVLAIVVPAGSIAWHRWVQPMLSASAERPALHSVLVMPFTAAAGEASCRPWQAR